MTAERDHIIGEFAAGAWLAAGGGARELVAAADFDEFARAASGVVSAAEHGEVLERALGLTVQSAAAPPELSFIGLFAALESVLTFFRRQGDYKIMPAEDFAVLRRELQDWLRRHPLLERDAARRGFVYEKIRELNRYPFSHVFASFCERRALDLSDLWPVAGAADDWPLMEIRHRLVHGDPFRERPAPAFACAREHLKWTTARMILAALGWPVARSRVSPAELSAAGGAYHGWQEQRARFS